MNTIIKCGFAALAAGAFSTLPSKAETPDLSNPFTRHGLPVPGAYFKVNESHQPTTVAVSKSEKRAGEQKQLMSNAGKKHTQRVAWMTNH
jgi:hypothetical protein